MCGRFDGTLAEFRVEGNGPGVPESERDQVFQRGYTTDADGTGLGLAIVERAVEARGWSIAVTEGKDGGARFEIRTDGDQPVDPPTTTTED